MSNKELEEIRALNSARLEPVLEMVRSGADCHLLVPYAKAYLGLFLNLNNSLSPDERLASFVDRKLIPAIYEGISNSVTRYSYPVAADFARQHNEAGRELCWVILAAIEYGIMQKGNVVIDELPEEVRKSAFCFVMTLEQSERPAWPLYYARRYKNEMEQALIESWDGIPAVEADYLPGMDWFFEHVSEPGAELIYWLASHWKYVHYGNTYQLLSLAVRHGDAGRLRTLSQQAMQRELPVKVKMLWCGLGLVSDPDGYAVNMQSLCGFNKEKIVPLLDFCISVIKYIDDPVRKGKISAALIRIAGPKFPPFDSTDPIVSKLLYAQELLAQCPKPERRQLIDDLLAVRVLRAYKPALRALASQP